MEDLKRANKAINKLTEKPIKIKFPKLTGSLGIEVFSDASFRNLPDQISSGRGHIVFLTGGGRAAVIGWNSNKVKRVVGSTVAAEALSLKMVLDHRHFLRAILAEIMNVEMKSIPMIAHVDSKNLYEAIRSTKFVEDKKLRLDIAQIQEAVTTENVEIKWVPTGEMIADCLTKRGVKTDKILENLETGYIEKGETEKME